MKIRRKNINLELVSKDNNAIEVSGLVADRFVLFYLNYGEMERLKKLCEEVLEKLNQ